jgi:hypothetical protein
MAGQKREARLRADDPAIHVSRLGNKGVDAREKPGHDEVWASMLKTLTGFGEYKNAAGGGH